jgi:hypothetical protein
LGLSGEILQEFHSWIEKFFWILHIYGLVNK